MFIPFCCIHQWFWVRFKVWCWNICPSGSWPLRDGEPSGHHPWLKRIASPYCLHQGTSGIMLAHQETFPQLSLPLDTHLITCGCHGYHLFLLFPSKGIANLWRGRLTRILKKPLTPCPLHPISLPMCLQQRQRYLNLPRIQESDCCQHPTMLMCRDINLSENFTQVSCSPVLRKRWSLLDLIECTRTTSILLSWSILQTTHFISLASCLIFPPTVPWLQTHVSCIMAPYSEQLTAFLKSLWLDLRILSRTFSGVLWFPTSTLSVIFG